MAALGSDLHISVIVTVAVVLMVKVPFHQVIDVIAVGNSLVAAVGAVYVLCVMAITVVTVCAVCGIGRIHLKLVLLHLSLMWVVHVTIVQIIGMAVVLDGGVTTIVAVLVVVIGVCAVLLRHAALLLFGGACGFRVLE